MPAARLGAVDVEETNDIPISNSPNSPHLPESRSRRRRRRLQIGPHLLRCRRRSTALPPRRCSRGRCLRRSRLYVDAFVLFFDGASMFFFLFVSSFPKKGPRSVSSEFDCLNQFSLCFLSERAKKREKRRRKRKGKNAKEKKNKSTMKKRKKNRRSIKKNQKKSLKTRPPPAPKPATYP